MEERCPTQAILTLVVICFSTLDCTQSLRWAAFNGTIPKNGITLRPGDRNGRYFCRVQKDCGGVKTGGESFGVLNKVGETCDYPDTKSLEIISCPIFDVMVGDQSRVGLKWLREERVVGTAIPCHLDMTEESDCYFGEGLYSDGICDEEPGVIHPSNKLIYMKDPFKSKQVSRCPFYTILSLTG